MKNKNQKRKAGKEGKTFSINQDPFFTDSKKRRKSDYDDDDIDSVDSEEELEVPGGSYAGVEEDNEGIEETADERRKRIAAQYLEKIREIAKREREEEEEHEDERESEKEGERDTLVAKILQQEQLEESGRVRRVIASR